MTEKSGRLVVVSNRVATPDRDGRPASGGLAVALRDALRERRGIWFGWSGRLTEAPSAKPHLSFSGGTAYALIDLSADEFERYYNGFANRCLWPVMHYRLGLIEFSREDYAAYLAVNERFAEALFPLLEPADLVWIHDYHLIPLAMMLRRLGHKGRIGYFHHIPWPPPEVFGALPFGADLLSSMAAYDLAGVQTVFDARNLTDCLAENGGEAGASEACPRVEAFPIGIDAKAFARMAERSLPAQAIPASGTFQVIGVDRLDYSKGIVPRMLAFERFLERHPHRRAKTSLLQIAPPSRSDVPEYMELDRLSDETAGRINAAFSELDWTPIQVIKKSFSRPVLAGLQRRSAVGLVTPMRDGMNLVAKEFVAAQDAADPGVLVLSRFAGAARQLQAALLVNPFDLTEMADAIERALAMPLEQRLSRHAALLRSVMHEDVAWWRRRYLQALAEAGQHASA
jgi:trehalose 6-phosphate synthase